MNLGVARRGQRMSISLTMNKYRLQSLLLCFVLHMQNIIELKLYITDQRKLLVVFQSVLCEIKKKDSQIYSRLKISQSINVE